MLNPIKYIISTALKGNDLGDNLMFFLEGGGGLIPSDFHLTGSARDDKIRFLADQKKKKKQCSHMLHRQTHYLCFRIGHIE